MHRIVAGCAALVFAACFLLSRTPDNSSPRSGTAPESVVLSTEAGSAPQIECGLVPRLESEFAGKVALNDRYDGIKSVSSSCGCVSVLTARINGNKLEAKLRIRPSQSPEIDQTLKFLMIRGVDTFSVNVRVHALVTGIWAERNSIDAGTLRNGDVFSVRVTVVGIDEPLAIKVEGGQLALVSQKRIAMAASALHTEELKFRVENETGEFIEKKWLISATSSAEAQHIRVAGSIIGDFTWRPFSLVLKRDSAGKLPLGRMKLAKTSDGSAIDASRCSIVGGNINSFVEDGELCIHVDVAGDKKFSQSTAEIFVDDRLIGKIRIFAF